MHKEKELSKSALEFIEGEFVNVRQSTVRSVEGGHVELQQVGALSIDGDRIDITQGAAGILKGHDIHINQSISAVTAADNVSINFSLAQMSFSREQTTVSRSAVGFMAGKEIKADNSSAFLMLSGKVEGNVTTLLDWKSALAVGAVFGGLWGFISLLFNRK
jgi:hypothetical protein